MEPILSIIVPVYKIKEEYLRQCIESLIMQESDGYKVILVDDGSPDACGQICDEYANQNDKVTVIHQKNQGVSVARNSGMKVASTPWITFVDADDWVTYDYVKTIYNIVSADAANSDIIMFEYIREYKDTISVEGLKKTDGYLTQDEINNVGQATFYKLLQNGKFNPYSVISLMAKVYRRDFLLVNNIWYIPEARKGQDRLFNADALNATDKIYYLHKVLYHYRCWGESRTNRYDPNVPALTVVEINNLKMQAEKHSLQDQMDRYIKCRTCTRLYACMRLYFFHDNNEKSYKEKISECKDFVNQPLFKDALETVDMALLSSQEKLFVYAIKANMYSLVFLLVKAKSGRLKKKLN